MQWIHLFILGLAFGVMSALSMGPVGVLIFRYTLRGQRREALLCIVGQVTAIFSYVTIVTIGLEGLLLDHPRVFHTITLVGTVLVLGLGILTLRSASRGSALTAVQQTADSEPQERTAWRTITTAFVLALTNPGVLFLLLTSIALHSTVLGGSLRGVHLAAYLLSVLAGIEGWFLLVIAVLPILVRRPTIQRWVLRYLEWIAGGLLLVFGLFLLFKLGSTLLR